MKINDRVKCTIKLHVIFKDVNIDIIFQITYVNVRLSRIFDPFLGISIMYVCM